ncbi:urease accessory protein UreE [Arthrobacter sp. H35-D1]|uniref:urease accessory protein UreE n=1 Tax=Arthrobacter sp. H35-D1 TaxID=3046202 RepID=UPI0024BB7EF0|nr:urease accessory protein UreE [Arthrobacter sp. H35-D1]MDJ0312445.1 urease accessory protein UreE [Arthrobacter sp. H35-D1]
MIVNSVIGNVHHMPAAGLDGMHVEKVLLSGADLSKRIQRVCTDHGTEVGLRLRATAGSDGDLCDGDILFRDAATLIVVTVLPTDVLVIAPRSVLQMGSVAHQLGNRHLQAQFFGMESDYGAEVMVVPYDHTVVQLLDHLVVPYSRQERVMAAPFRHAEHTH